MNRDVGRWVLRWIAPDDLPMEAGVLGTRVALGGAVARPSLVRTSPRAGHLSLGVEPAGTAAPARLDQVHGVHVAVVDRPGVTPACDAAVTIVPGLPLTIRTADCLPVFVAGPRGVGIAHSGWRGAAGDIAGATVDSLTALSGDRPAHLVAFIGPAIGPCCYEVGPEVAGQFDAAFLSPGQVNPRLDLVAVVRSQLERRGLPPDRILESGFCTRCHQHLFHSHRGSGGKKGRIDATIRLRG
jgi:YfiH family protein